MDNLDDHLQYALMDQNIAEIFPTDSASSGDILGKRRRDYESNPYNAFKRNKSHENEDVFSNDQSAKHDSAHDDSSLHSPVFGLHDTSQPGQPCEDPSTQVFCVSEQVAAQISDCPVPGGKHLSQDMVKKLPSGAHCLKDWPNVPVQVGPQGKSPEATEAALEVTDVDKALDQVLADPESYVQSLGLPILDHLGMSIVDFCSLCSIQQLLDIYDKPESRIRKAWDALWGTFHRTRCIFETDFGYLDANMAGRFQHRHGANEPLRCIRTANIATAIYALLFPSYQALQVLKQRLWVVFNPIEEVVSDHMEIIVHLVGQVYLTRRFEVWPEHMTDNVFPDEWQGEMMDRIPHSRPELRSAFDIEIDMKKSSLMMLDCDESDMLKSRLRLLCGLKKYLDEKVKPRSEGWTTSDMTASNEDATGSSPNGYVNDLSQFEATMDSDNDEDEDVFDQQAMIRNAAAAAHAALKGQNVAATSERPLRNASPGDDSALPTSLKLSNGKAPGVSASNTPEPSGQTGGEEPEGTRSTREQYEKAKLAATAKANAKQSRAAMSTSQRRPWSTEEENALMLGLDRVKGPHWSQILAMFGAGGTVSEVLKDRNQVQLKDKARNLKLFFLKSGADVPAYLKHVTGELKTRAPARAAKQEVQERLQRSGSEDKATSAALSALTGGTRFMPPIGAFEMKGTLSTGSTKGQQVGGGSQPSTLAHQVNGEEPLAYIQRLLHHATGGNEPAPGIQTSESR